MQNVYSIATKPSYLEQLLNEAPVNYDIRYQARPGMMLPMIIDNPEGNKLVSAVWGMNLPGTKKPTACIHMNKMFKDKNVTQLVRKQRCAIPANCFIVKKTTTRLVRILKQRIFCMGGVYKIEQRGNQRRYTFALLLTEPADMLTPYCNEMPICFAMDHWKDWVGNELLSDIMHRADRASLLWYDHFPVSEQVLESYVNDRELLAPLRLSKQQQDERQAGLDKIKMDELRANSGGKH